MPNDLEGKLEKYESKAVQCRKAAQEAIGNSGREFYEGLARYYAQLATDFRQILEKRKST
jgi:hypothetical protein